MGSSFGSWVKFWVKLMFRCTSIGGTGGGILGPQLVVVDLWVSSLFFNFSLLSSRISTHFTNSHPSELYA